MDDMRIEAVMVPEEGNLEPLGEHLMEAALAFFDTEEGEKEYQAWKAARGKILRCAQNDTRTNGTERKERSA